LFSNSEKDFFNHLEVISRPIHHAEEEFDGIVPSSSRFCEIKKNRSFTYFWAQITMIVFFVFYFLNQLRVFSRPLQHADEELRGPGSASSRFSEIIISA
jgi:hypothetical protein